MRFLMCLLFIIIFTTPSSAFYEKDYQKLWCTANKGQIEVVLPDKTRVDCVTRTHAIEFDFAKKWGESIGQSLYYAAVLDKTPGIVLIMENSEKDIRYLKRLQKVARQYGISVWTVTPKYFKGVSK